jgi:hypothetical protein
VHLKHKRRIDNVLRGRPFVEAALQLLRQLGLDRLDEWNRWDASQCGLATKQRDVECGGIDLLDGVREVVRHQAEPRLRPRQCGFDPQHGAEIRPVRKGRAHLFGREQRAEEAGIESREGHEASF